MSPTSASETPTWRTQVGRWVAIHALERSYPARHLGSELRTAEHAATVLAQLLEFSQADPPAAGVQIFLVEPIEATTEATLTDRGLVRVLRPDAPRPPLALRLTPLLLARWFGPPVGRVPLVVEGLAGLVAGRLDEGPSLADCDEWVRQQQESGAAVSVAAGDADLDGRLATSFVGFLQRSAGGGAVRRFLAAYDPERRDQAAMVAFQRPLGALEEAWRNAVRRRPGAAQAFASFWGRLRPLLRAYTWRQAEVFACMVFGLAYSLAVPLASKYLVDTVIPSGSYGLLAIFIVGLLGLYLVDGAVEIRRAYVSSWVNQRVLVDLQEQVFGHLQRLPHSFYARARVGDLMARLSGDLGAIQVAMVLVLSSGPFLALKAVAAAVAILALNWMLGLAVLLVVPVFVLSYSALRGRIRELSYHLQELAGEGTTVEQEHLSAHAVIKAFGLEERAVAIYRSTLDRWLRAMLRLVLVSSAMDASTNMAVSLAQLVVLGVGGALVMSDHLSVGTLLAFIGLLASLLTPVATLAQVGQTVQRASGALERVVEVLDEPVSISDAMGADDLPRLSREIRFEQVVFGYEPERAVLQGLELTLPAGRHTAIVGPSGSGKSTLVSLLLRFWDPQAGSVTFDGRDLRAVRVASLRKQIGVVFQDTFVFDTTLRENIAVGQPGSTDREVEFAAKAAHLAEWIASLPAGYDTVLGERGVRMSGGQRQRLALARALVRDPAVMLLDEATSALDAHTEREVLAAVQAAAHGRTLISVTHRLALAASADHVVVLDEGRIVEEGPHAQLARSGGLYQRLWEEQMGGAATAWASSIDVGRLAAVPLFAGCSPEDLARLAGHVTARRYGAGQDVVRHGELGETLYLVVEGHLDVLLPEGPAEHRVNVLIENDYFGEMALLTREPRTATVRAATPTLLYELTSAEFSRLLEREPSVQRGVEETVARRRAALTAATRRPEQVLQV